LLNEVDLAYSETAQVNDMTMRRFKIVMTVDLSADIRAIAPTIVDPTETPRNGFGAPGMQAAVDLLPTLGREGD
jgi:hypothetical protein